MLKQSFTIVMVIASLNAMPQSQQNPLYNPSAPNNITMNLNLGDKAIAVDKGDALKIVKIYPLNINRQ